MEYFYADSGALMLFPVLIKKKIRPGLEALTLFSHISRDRAIEFSNGFHLGILNYSTSLGMFPAFFH
jgi:hypothetical protein